MATGQVYLNFAFTLVPEPSPVLTIAGLVGGLRVRRWVRRRGAGAPRPGETEECHAS
jgi:hypothetical protein